MDFLAEIKEIEQLASQTVENMTLPPEGSSLVDIIMHTTRDFHSDKTGGTLHKISLGTAHIIAGTILNEAEIPVQVIGRDGVTRLYKVHYPLIGAAIAGESCFDPLARNPNNQNGKPGDSPTIVDQRTDYGLGQINGQPQYYANIALSVLKVKTVLAQNLAWAATLDAKRDVFTAFTPQDVGVTSFRLGAQAYNTGQLGALESTQFDYADGVIGRYDKYCQTLNIENRYYPLTVLVGGLEKTIDPPIYHRSDLVALAATERAKWAK